MRHDAGIALLQLALHIQFVGRLLQRALGFLKLAFRLQNIGLRSQLGGVDLRNLAPGGFQRACCFELSNLKITSPFLTGALN